MAKPRKAASGTKKTDAQAKVRKAKSDKLEEKAMTANRADRPRVKFESTLTRLEAVAYFEAIVVGLKKGALKFKQGEEAISLAPSEHVEVEVKAQRKKGKENVSFEITWQTADDGDLTISSD